MSALTLDAGPLLGQAATLLDNASRDTMRAALHLDAAGLDIAPEFAALIEDLAWMATEAVSLADSFATAAATGRST